MTMIMTSPKLILAVAAVSTATVVVRALDVELTSFKCNSDMPVQVTSLSMDCNGLANSGFYNDGKNGYMYLSADMKLASYDYSLMNSYAIPICWDYKEEYNNNGDAAAEAAEVNYQEAQAEEVVDDDDGRFRKLEENVNKNCPQDGEYQFNTRYRLPSTNNQAVSWASTGWGGTVKFHLYALSQDAAGESYKNFYIGYCEAKLETSVTPNSQQGFLQTPSASTAAGILSALLVASLLLCMYCYCCIRRLKKKRKFEPQKEGDDITSSFRRMSSDEEPEKVNVDGKLI